MTSIETFKAASPRRQLALALGVVVLIGLILTAAYLTLLRRPYDVLFTNLRPMDAATITAELDKKKAPYRLADGGRTIMVPKEMADGLRLNVMSEDLPLKGTVGFELFNKSDMGLTEFAQRINYQRALQGELARTIMTLDSVETARLHLSMPEPTVFRSDAVAPKASVTIVTRPGKSLLPATVLGVQRLVAAAVPNLVASDVVVLDEQGTVVSSTAGVDSASPESQTTRGLEEYYTGKIRLALSDLYQSSEMQVVVSTPRTLPGAERAPVDTAGRARGFPIRVDVALPTLPGADAQTEIKRLVGGVIGFDAGLGDVIALGVADHIAASTETVAPAAAVAKAPILPGAPADGRRQIEAILIAALVLGVILGGGFLLLRPRDRFGRKLSESERQAYVQRLKALLSSGEADAVPPL